MVQGIILKELIIPLTRIDEVKSVKPKKTMAQLEVELAKIT